MLLMGFTHAALLSHRTKSCHQLTLEWALWRSEYPKQWDHRSKTASLLLTDHRQNNKWHNLLISWAGGEEWPGSLPSCQLTPRWAVPRLPWSSWAGRLVLVPWDRCGREVAPLTGCTHTGCPALECATRLTTGFYSCLLLWREGGKEVEDDQLFQPFWLPTLETEGREVLEDS